MPASGRDEGIWSDRGDDHVSPRPGALPGWLVVAAAPVVSDLVEPTGALLSFGYLADDETTDLGLLCVCDADGVLLHGFGVSRQSTLPARTVQIAEGVQEHLFELPAVKGYWHPVCPGHSHAAIPSEADGRAYWICPETRQRLHAIGEGSLEDADVR